MGNRAISLTAPPDCCTRNVATAETAASAKSGIFSITAFRESRRSGQASNTSSSNGRVTIIGLDINPRMNQSKTAR